jgi:CRISPR-associated protein Cmr2
MKYLFLFSVTPVQAFISQARKTQDLYAGSFILSHLCRTAAERVEQKYKARVIFPKLTNEAIINRFLAVVDDSNRENNRAMGLDIEKSVQEEFRRMAETLLSKMEISGPPGFSERLLKQINNYWHCYWLFEEYPDKQFATAYKKAEQAFGTIKNTRKFMQFEQEPARKCSVTGEHNVLFYRTGQKQGFVPDFATALSDKIPLKYLDSKEKLGGITFVKRCAGKYFESERNYIKDFPSTADIALMDLLEKCRGKIPETGVSTVALFDKYNGKHIPQSLADGTKENTEKVYMYLKSNKVELTPYYAMVLFDGDYMGKWLAGNFINGETLEDFQGYLSNCLGQFAGTAGRDIVIPPKGRTVYAGGDDFLGFININHLFETLKELRSKFEQIDLSKYTNRKLTFSAGVVVAHWKAPLSEVLGWARRMENEAKNIDGDKDAFALAVLKHSGEIHKTIYKWRYDGAWTVDLLEDLINKIKGAAEEQTSGGNASQGQEFSNNFIKTINLVFQKLMDEGGNLCEDSLIKSEIKRLLHRSCLLRKKPGETFKEFELRKKLAVHSLRERLEKLHIYSNNFQDFLSALSIADFLAREMKE